jgi:hypothetical protein
VKVKLPNSLDIPQTTAHFGPGLGGRCDDDGGGDALDT